MSLIKAILRKSNARMSEGTNKKYSSPPPEVDETAIAPKRKKKIHKYAYVLPRVDSSPPRYNNTRNYRRLQQGSRDFDTLFSENLQLLTMIKRAHWRGKVDSHWKFFPKRTRQYYKRRVDFASRVNDENKHIHHHLTTAVSRVPQTSSLHHDWCRNRQDIVMRALYPFVLFPPGPHEDMEDPVFTAPTGVKRPRVYMTIGIRGCAVLGELCLELFTDMCPDTCRLFTELLDGDTLGHGYVGTCFFRKVPNLYWCGGDVTHNNGFGCYAQRGRVQPIGAENFHFPHSMPGLLSMPVTCDDECCGMFNITFKPLPQFDLHNVVFGRVIRPCLTYKTVQVIGKALSSHPIVEVRATRRCHESRWVRGLKNTKVEDSGIYQARRSLSRRR